VISEPPHLKPSSANTITIHGFENLSALLPPTTRRTLKGCFVVPQFSSSKDADPLWAPKKRQAVTTIPAMAIFILRRRLNSEHSGRSSFIASGILFYCLRKITHGFFNLRTRQNYSEK